MSEIPQSERAGRLPGAPPLRDKERWLDVADRITDAYGLVLLLVMATVVFASLLPGTGWGAVLTVVACNMTALVALTTSRAPMARVKRAIGVLAVTSGLAALSAVLGIDSLLALAYCGAVLLLAVAMATVLVSVVTVQHVDSRTLLGAVSVYTSMGVLFTFAFKAIDRFQPGPFFGSETAEQTGDFVFFSYTTLTTTGYGNLVPAEQPGKLFALLEMLTGQIFLVTLVAGLVTLWRPPRRLGGDRGNE
jgi:hypothetical protein